MFLPKINAIFFQTLATLLGNLLTIGYGVMFGMTPPIQVLYQTEDTPLNRPITEDDMSWITTYLAIGGLFGTIIFGHLADRWGRRASLLWSGILQIASWFCATFAYDIVHIYVSRVLGGIAGGAGFAVLPLYVSEISEDKFRGSLGSVISTFRNLGILIGFIIGSYVEYESGHLIGLGISVIFVLSFPFVEESPYYHLMKNNMKLMEKSLRWFRAIRNYDQLSDPVFLNEVEQFRRKQIEMNELGSNLRWNDFFCWSTFKALIIGVVLITGTQFCGVFAILNYAPLIFNDAGFVLSPNVSSIILAAAQLIGSYFGSLLSDKIGHKVLISISCLASSLCLGVFGACMFLKEHNYNFGTYMDWIPLVSSVSSIIMTHIGLYPMTYVIISEIFPQKIKGILTTFFLSLSWIWSLLIVKFFFTITQLIGIYGCIWMFSSVLLFEFIFTILFIPETRGRSFEEILKIMK